MNNALLQNALRAHRAGDLAQAARLYGDVLRAEPGNFDALYWLGMVLLQNGQFAEAERQFGEALAINRRSGEALYHRGRALQGLDRGKDALACYEKAVGFKPDLAGAWHNRGVLLSQLGRYADALVCFDKTLALQPGSVESWNNRGNALSELKRYGDAIGSFDKALTLRPDYADAWNNRGVALDMTGRFPEAVESYGKALAIDPAGIGALTNRGRALVAMGRIGDGLADFDRVLARSPGDLDALNRRGSALFRLRRYEEAAADFQKLLAWGGDAPYAKGTLLHCRIHCCDWRGLAEERDALGQGLEAGLPTIDPFCNTLVSSSAAEQLLAARIYVTQRCPPQKPLWRGERYTHDRIRIAYVSPDFRNHAVASLIAGVFEHHDRARFETVAISLCGDDQSPMRRRLVGAFERFIDVQNENEDETARRLRQMEIDIAVDLGGYTAQSRPRIFAARPAPLQVNYLGFPATSGAGYVNYILADRIVVPDEHRGYYSEKIAYLPDSYQANDTWRPIAPRSPSRAEEGLPASGFVFCCFNNNYKIMPEQFDAWMRILHGVEGSVLWLYVDNPVAVRHLRREAEARGIAPHRLVFASQKDQADHLARHRLADLFLDTLPYNAHTTASDALWAGLPVLTCLGTTFAGRVAASLLHAVGMPETITPSRDAYEAMAIALAQDPAALASLREKLVRHRDTCRLFDTARHTRNLEAAFAVMWRRRQSGEAAADFTVTLGPLAP